MTLRADFTSQEYLRNPADAIEKLRAAGPVVEVRFPFFGMVWTTTTQDLANQVLRDSETFTLRKDDGNVVGFRWWMPKIVRTISDNMLSIDEPDHARLRAIVDESFHRRAVLEMEPRILAIAGELADELFAEGSPADLVDRYAQRLPLSVICELLGLPLADRRKFTAWANGFTRLTGALSFFSVVPKIFAIKRYMERRLDAARENGGSGLIAELVRVEKEGGRISRNEMVAMLFLLLLAGHETTTHLISGSVRELLRNPGLRDWLEEDWRRADLAIEEFLRFVSPVQFSRPRFVRKDVELGGARLKKGEKSCPCWPPETSIRERTNIRKSSILAGGRTTTSPSAPGFIFAWATSSRVLKASARCKPCSSVGRSSSWPQRIRTFAGANDQVSGPSGDCRS
jgi:cytochrome P450 PksS